MIVAILIGVGLLVGIGALSLVSGALNFLFVRPKIEILRSSIGSNGFAFLYKWDQDAEPVTFNRVRIQLFNPFGSPTQVDVAQEFDGSSTDFARDVDLSEAYAKLKTATGLDKATVEIEVMAMKDGVTYKKSMKANEFLKQVNTATVTAADMNDKLSVKSSTIKVEIPERTFIAEPMTRAEKHIVIPTNPIFASVLAGAGGGGAAAGPAAENFTIAKVWIEPGCIVCDACEGIYPEVFEVTDSTCIIRPGAPLDDGLRMQDAAEACPVEVIKFTKAS